MSEKTTLAKTKRIYELENDYDSGPVHEDHVLEYKCTCGKKILLFEDKKPKRLKKCFECLGKF